MCIYIYYTIIQRAGYYLSGVLATVWRKQIRLRPDKSDIEDAMLTDQTLYGVPLRPNIFQTRFFKPKLAGSLSKDQNRPKTHIIVPNNVIMESLVVFFMIKLFTFHLLFN